MSAFHDMMADKMAGHDGEDGEDGGDESPDYDHGYKTAVKQFIEAVKSDDEEGAMASLRTAISLCSKMKEPDGDEDGGGGHAALLVMPHGKG